ncbi:sigma-70 family RNA polymerase sigma factor [Acanthopleuribacter pedis]|uniref:Sigma-70 family RNA polymerase sigma factor n=1 Tax=Acanthopleuribacter pedis TaxID=442870 RepID=A0A8J7U4V6_9BACT|nr:sigma-70 family RNA polymerase sigma factor [Acanthopleuribacter pedis]MBO1321858.1 sigma-70 family RNA polymerase sigma factor [Acanthopleuribacter pedis]
MFSQILANHPHDVPEILNWLITFREGRQHSPPSVVFRKTFMACLSGRMLSDDLSLVRKIRFLIYVLFQVDELYRYQELNDQQLPPLERFICKRNEVEDHLLLSLSRPRLRHQYLAILKDFLTELEQEDPKGHDIFLLRFLEGYSLKKVASEVGLTTSGVHYRIEKIHAFRERFKAGILTRYGCEPKFLGGVLGP